MCKKRKNAQKAKNAQGKNLRKAANAKIAKDA